MTLPENSPRFAAPSANGKPSLLGGDAAPSGVAGDAPSQPMRMLDSLDAAKVSRSRQPSRRQGPLIVALALGLSVAASYWWWDRSGAGVVSPGLVEASRQNLPTQAGGMPAALPEPAAVAAASAPAPASLAEPADDALAGPASIERTAIAERAPVAAGPFASAPIRPFGRPMAAALPSSTPPAMPRVAAAAARSNPRPVPPRVAEAAPPSNDPDVTLLSAMLARLSGDSTTTAPRPTIAQLVERCEAQAARDSNEAVECKRRICAGYWGKAEACPLALAPGKN